MFRYDTSTFEQLGVFNTSPNESPNATTRNGFPARGAGIWQGGGGLAADESGQVYLMTGNGPADREAVTRRGTYGDHFLKFAPRGYTLQLSKAYTPRSPDPDKDFLKKDWDLGAGGPLLVPGTDRVLGGGKEGIYYVLNRNTFELVENPLQAYDNLYESCTGKQPSDCWRKNQWMGGPHLHGNPAYWNGYVYQQAEMDVLKAYKFEFGTGKLGETPIKAKECNLSMNGNCVLWGITPNGAYMRNQLSVSSYGNNAGSGVVWATLDARADGAPGSVIHRLAAYNAEDLNLLWYTDIRDLPKWGPPTIADGKVYIANNSNEVRVYVLGP